MTQVAVIGNTVADLILDLPKSLAVKSAQTGKIELPLGSKIELSQFQLLLGGCGANLAVGLTRLGLKCELITPLGEDAIGAELRRRLFAETTVCPISIPQSSFSLVLSAKNDRVVLASHQLDSWSSKLNLPESDWLVLGPLPNSAGPLFGTVATHQVKYRSHLAINPSLEMILDRHREFMAALKNCDVIFLNREEALALTRLGRTSDLDTIVKSVGHLGPKIVCVTDGSKGALVQMGNLKRFGRRLTSPSEVVDATGAGDAFASGFLAGYIAKKREVIADDELLERALSYGLLNSASVVTQFGGQAGLQTLSEIERDLKYVKLEVR